MSPNPVQSPFIVFLALVTVQILFGLNYIISKSVVMEIPPLLWGSLRNIIAFFVMLFIALIFYKKHFPNKKELPSYIWPLFGFALLGGILNQAFFLVGLKYTTSNNSAIINTLIPVFTFLFVTLKGLESITLKRMIGFILAFVGVLVLRNVENFTLSESTVLGDVLTLLNALSFGAFLALSKKFMETHNKAWVTTFIFLYGSLGLSVLSIDQYAHFPLIHWSTGLVWACIFSVIGATVIPDLLNNWALSYAQSSTVAILIYIQPVITMFVNWYWMDVVPTFREVSSSVIIFSGVLLVVFGNKKRVIHQIELKTKI